MTRRLPFTRQMLLLQLGVLLVLGICSLVAVGWMLRVTMERQYEQRALAVARTVASDPELGDLVAVDDQPRVQQIALTQGRRNGALFVVVTDKLGIRLAHPNPDAIGKKVSTDPRAALSGKEVVLLERGTLGLSARGKVPLRDSAGRIVGEVSVGFAASEVDAAVRSMLFVAVPVGVLGIAGAMLATAALARRLKRGLFGLEPAEVADLLREHDAVLYGIGEGVLAFDTQGRVAMCNDEARRLLDLPVERGIPAASLGLPARLAEAVGGESADVTAVSGDRVLVARHRVVQSDDRELGSVLTLRDRTDVEQLTSELASVRTMTSALRAQRHEFANRMHMVIGLLQTGSPDDALAYLQAGGGAVVAEDPFDPEALQSNTIRAFLAAKVAYAAERAVTLTLSETTWVPRKLVAPVEVVTVLGNLVDNAIDAAAEQSPGRVEIDLLGNGRDLVLSVANTGPGLDEMRAEAIFADGVSTRGPGRGHGLAIARHTARRLGGEVRVTAFGGGEAMTVFVAELPDVLEDKGIGEVS
ncbi:sensor histidine kinase [Calidifontibacter sp. DB0510]|uniref:histidine kinase n=1 Tax=Metallococcus carri TaxID=1656884 RepID=A0A967E8Q2_9MICO|nr:sensor histidine kinase [Metallococcus carri]NHN55472.1 sensor histidine kinase [Metallococcus carri]NOP38344.1 sensor histidine kinase [Calidifontibacter sp. DB2511S]